MSKKIIHKDFLVALLKKCFAQFIKKGNLTGRYTGITASDVVDTFEKMAGKPIEGYIEDIVDVNDINPDTIYLSKNNNGEYYCIKRPDNITQITNPKYFINISDLGAYERMNRIEQALESGGTSALNAIENLKKALTGNGISNPDKTITNFPMSNAQKDKIYFYNNRPYLCIKEVSSYQTEPIEEFFTALDLRNIFELKVDKEPIDINSVDDLDNLKETSNFKIALKSDTLLEDSTCVGYTIAIAGDRAVQTLQSTADEISNGKFRIKTRIFNGNTWGEWTPIITYESIDNQAHINGGTNKIPNSDSVKITYDKAIEVENKLINVGAEDNNTKFFKANGRTGTVENYREVGIDKISGVYVEKNKDNSGSDMVVHFKANGGKVNASQFRILPNNGGLYYRSNIENSNFTEEVEIWNSGNFEIIDKDSDITDKNANNIIKSGTYSISRTSAIGSNNYPTNSKGILNVSMNADGLVLQTFITEDNSVFGRSLSGSVWSLWKIVDGSDRIPKGVSNINSLNNSKGVAFEKINNLAINKAKRRDLSILRFNTETNDNNALAFDYNGGIFHRAYDKDNGLSDWSKLWTEKDHAYDDLGISNLNSITKPGIYWCLSNANSTTGRNYPIDRAGSLEVFLGGNGILQRYTTYDNKQMYVRDRNQDSSWNSWKRIDGIDKVDADFVRNETSEKIMGKNYGGILNVSGTKYAGKIYYDNNTKAAYLCKNNNSDISANPTNYIALDNNSLLERLENLYKTAFYHPDRWKPTKENELLKTGAYQISYQNTTLKQGFAGSQCFVLVFNTSAEIDDWITQVAFSYYNQYSMAIRTRNSSGVWTSWRYFTAN